MWPTKQQMCSTAPRHWSKSFCSNQWRDEFTSSLDELFDWNTTHFWRETVTQHKATVNYRNYGLNNQSHLWYCMILIEFSRLFIERYLNRFFCLSWCSSHWVEKHDSLLAGSRAQTMAAVNDTNAHLVQPILFLLLYEMVRIYVTLYSARDSRTSLGRAFAHQS